MNRRLLFDRHALDFKLNTLSFKRKAACVSLQLKLTPAEAGARFTRLKRKQRSVRSGSFIVLRASSVALSITWLCH